MEQINTAHAEKEIIQSYTTDILRTKFWGKLTKTKAQKKLLNELPGGMSWSLISLHELEKLTEVSGRRDVFPLQLNFLMLFELWLILQSKIGHI